jgi:hypothetical protein
MNPDRRQRRDCSLFPIDAQFPKLASGPFRPRNAMKDRRLSTLDVAGSIPVSRSSFQELSASTIPAVSINFQNKRTSSRVLTERARHRARAGTKPKDILLQTECGIFGAKLSPPVRRFLRRSVAITPQHCPGLKNRFFVSGKRSRAYIPKTL